MFLPILAAAVGGLFNRIRGGGVILFPGETTDGKKRTQVRRIIYLLALGGIVMLNGGTLWQAAMGALVVFVRLQGETETQVGRP